MDAQPLTMDRDSILTRMAKAMGPRSLANQKAEAALDASGLMERIGELEAELRRQKAEVSAGVDFLKFFMEKRREACSKITGSSWPRTKMEDGRFRRDEHIYGTEEALREFEYYSVGVLDLAVEQTLKRLEQAVAAPTGGRS
jgi:hypothetical protein